MGSKLPSTRPSVPLDFEVIPLLVPFKTPGILCRERTRLAAKLPPRRRLLWGAVRLQIASGNFGYVLALSALGEADD